MSIAVKMAGLALLFLLMIASGIRLTKTGKPYNGAMYNAHKIISLIAVVLAGIGAYNLYRGASGAGLLLLILMMVAGVLFLFLLVSGGLLNTETQACNILRMGHRISSVLAVVLSIVVFFLLLKG